MFLFLGFLISAQIASAATVYSSGCTATTDYSITTGQKCSLSLRGCTADTKYSPITGKKCVKGEVLGVSTDPTPRIAYWWGKVNQHVDSSGIWQTDPDGTSGANLDKLTYCKKWYPNTVKVESYVAETIDTWKDAGNVNNYSGTVVTDKCVQVSTDTKPSVTVIYPNGGEVYQAGQQITVKWKTSGIPDGMNALIILNDEIRGIGGDLVASTPNDGIEVVTLPTQSTRGSNLPFGGNFYKVRVSFVPFGGYDGIQLSDASDNLFTINAPETDLDPTPRIAYWWGKVNQHTDSNGVWKTDPDGTSGANIDKLT